jgi:hypothetical protein
VIIQPIVEGDGDLEALPVLLRRLASELRCFEVTVKCPIRRNRSDFNREQLVQRAVQLALLQPGCSGVLILFDADDDCPKETAPQVQQWARGTARGTPCEVVLANREYEAWFLAAIESLRGQRGIRADAVSEAQPENFRGAKRRLSEKMEWGTSYSEKADQPALTALMELAAVYRACRSFRRLVSAFIKLLSESGIPSERSVLRGWLEESS